MLIINTRTGDSRQQECRKMERELRPNEEANYGWFRVGPASEAISRFTNLPRFSSWENIRSVCLSVAKPEASRRGESLLKPDDCSLSRSIPKAFNTTGTFSRSEEGNPTPGSDSSEVNTLSLRSPDDTGAEATAGFHTPTAPHVEWPAFNAPGDAIGRPPSPVITVARKAFYATQCSRV